MSLLAGVFMVLAVDLAANPREIVVYHASWCRPCRQWEQTDLPDLLASGVPVRRVDVARGSVDGVTSVPAFRVVDRLTGEVRYECIGQPPASWLVRKARE